MAYPDPTGRQRRNQAFAALAALIALAVSLVIWTWQTLALIGFLAGVVTLRGKGRRR